MRSFHTRQSFFYAENQCHVIIHKGKGYSTASKVLSAPDDKNKRRPSRHQFALKTYFFLVHLIVFVGIIVVLTTAERLLFIFVIFTEDLHKIDIRCHIVQEARN